MVFSKFGLGRRRVQSHRSWLRSVLVAALCVIPPMISRPASAGPLDQLVSFHIQSESLRKALLDFGRQANLQVILPGGTETRRTVPGLSGHYTVREALKKFLAGTDLRYSLTRRTLEIFAEPSTQKAPAGSGAPHEPAHPGRMLSAQQIVAPKRQSGIQAPPMLRQVIVTGSHIEGGPPPSEPIMTITAKQIRESGYQSVEQLMNSLPETLNSVGSEQNGLASNTDAGNTGYGAAVDLLGLGYGSTLVLVNGHRLAPGGINGAFTDISVIPMSAIKRVDIVMDGASAIYGADAMAGVVNYVLKDRQHGAETSVEYGLVTRGSLKQYQVSQSEGMNWTTGHALIAYQYRDETPLNVLDRPYSASNAPGDLTPGLTQNSLYVSADQSVSQGTRITGTAFYSHRRDRLSVSEYSVSLVGRANVTQFSYGIGSDSSLRRGWSLRTHFSYGGNNTRTTTADGLLGGNDKLATGSLVASGGVLRVPSGMIKMALGAQIRYESLNSLFTGLYQLKNIARHRTVDSVFIEGQFPLIGGHALNTIGQRLSLDIAARFDHYSDFGSTLNPRLGIAWRPLRGIKFRTTLSSSFKAPNFFQLYGAQGSELLNSSTPQLPPAQTVAYLELYGSNPGLTAEKSVEWTAGFDWNPVQIPGASMNTTFYDVRFRNKISELAIPPFSALNQGGLYSAYIENNPSAAQLQAYGSARYGYFNVTTLPGYGPARTLLDAVAVVDDRFQNVGSTNVQGLMTDAEYDHEIHGYRYDVAFNGVYIFQFRDQSVAGAPAFSILDTLENPVRFRGRLSAGLHHGSWSMNAFLNYTKGYKDINPMTPVPVASWTTVNLSGSIRLFKGSGAWGKTTAYLSCLNCFDRAPPAVRRSSELLGYDASNANALGRFVSASISVRW